jgi:hypothetical protein
MCFSYDTSILSFSLGMVSGIFALLTNQIILGVLILFYCQMQLSEALIWKAIDTKNVKLNEEGTSYGKYLLPTHNIAIGLGVIFDSIINRKSLKILDFLPLIIGIIFYLFIIGFYYMRIHYKNQTYPENKSCTKKKCQNLKNRLQWPYPHSWYTYSFIISIIFSIIYLRSIPSKVFIISVFIITFLSTYFINPKVVGSVWCFSTAILAPFIVLVNYFLVENKV